MRREIYRGVLALMLAAGVPMLALSETAYTPPEIAQGEDGWERYVGPLMLTPENVAGLTPAPDSTEAAVVLYLASRIRGDSAWEDAMVDDPGARQRNH